MNARGNPDSGDGTHARFPFLTHWTTLIQPAADLSSPQAKVALNQLCQAYWFPIYAFIRSERIDSHQAKDLTQGFFVHVLEKNIIGQADREKGRFRSFLLAGLKNYMKDEWRREKAAKRGGDVTIISIDDEDAETKLGGLPVHGADSVQVFDRTWAARVVEQANERLKKSYAARGKVDTYEAMKGCLNGKLAPENYPDAAAELGMTKQTFEVNLSRFKVTFAKSVRSVIAETVSPADIEDEIRYLMSAWIGYLEQKNETKTKLTVDSV